MRWCAALRTRAAGWPPASRFPFGQRPTLASASRQSMKSTGVAQCVRQSSVAQIMSSICLIWLALKSVDQMDVSTCRGQRQAAKSAIAAGRGVAKTWCRSRNQEQAELEGLLCSKLT